MKCVSVVIVALGMLAAGCSSEPEERYELRGRVVAVDKDRKRLTVEHEEIPGYMPAMTMPFRVKDAWVLDAAAPGSEISGDLVVAGKGSWLERVTVTSESGRPSLPSRVEGATEPVVGEPAPEVALVNQLNERVSLDRYRDKAVALTFIYTRCPLPDYCPLMTDNFLEAKRTLDADPRLARSTQLLSISIDPEFDTPEVMRGYGERVTGGAIPANWEFLTGTPDEVRRVAERYGLVYEEDGDEVIHTLRTAVIAPDGTLVAVLRGNEWKPDDLVAEIRIAVARTGKGSAAPR